MDISIPKNSLNYWEPLMMSPPKNPYPSDFPSKSFFEETTCATIAIVLTVFLTLKLAELFAPIAVALTTKFSTVPMNGGAPIMTTPGKRTRAALECQLMNIL